MDSTSYSNGYVKSFSEYNQLGAPNPLIASPPLQIYPSMSYQYKNVTDGSINLGYTALAHGPYSGTGYGVYNDAYPNACSMYAIVKCPSEERVQILSHGTPSPTPSTNSSMPVDPSLVRALLALQIRVYIDPQHKLCQAFQNYVQTMGLGHVFTFLNVQDAGVRAQLMSESGGQFSLPFFFSGATGNVHAGPPPSLEALVNALQKGDGAISTSPSPVSPMSLETYEWDGKKKSPVN